MKRHDRRRVVRLRDGGQVGGRDDLAVEEPLEIRVDGQVVSVTMRTPGDDFELALGYCLTERIVAADDVAGIRYCTTDAPGPYQGDFNVVDLGTRSGVGPPPALVRRTSTSTSCGICGSDSIAAVRKAVPDVGADGVRVDPTVLPRLAERAREAQAAFDVTGGVHAAALFTPDGELVALREDVGRHNAVDKLVGWAATEGRLPLTGHVLFVSGRAAFEIVQKALVAGLPVGVAVSAPTALAVDLADEAGMTLVGFLRGDRANVYSHPQRLA